MTNKKYRATYGAPFNKKKAQIYGECLKKIEERNNRTIDPIDVVNEARKRNNPLHSFFDWDDTKAAEKYRLWQARNLINHITVEITYDHKKKDVKSWFSINETPNQKKLNKVYISVERAMEEPELRKQVLVGAIEEADDWRERYIQYKELSLVFNSIKKTKKKILKKAKPKKGKKRGNRR
jgi:hypothetical protein